MVTTAPTGQPLAGSTLDHGDSLGQSGGFPTGIRNRRIEKSPSQQTLSDISHGCLCLVYLRSLFSQLHPLFFFPIRPKDSPPGEKRPGL